GGCGGKQALPKLGRGKLVEGEIAANDGKSFRVLAQALGFETLLREPAALDIAVAGINLIQPAWVLPGTGPDPNILRYQRAQPCGQSRPVKPRSWIEERKRHPAPL